MELEKFRRGSEENRLLVYDKEDEDKAFVVVNYLANNGIHCITLSDYPGKNMFAVLAKLLPTLKKVIYIMSVSSDKNEQLNYILAMIISKIPKANIITLLCCKKDEKLNDEFKLLESSNVIRSDDSSWLEDVKNELTLYFPSYIKILNKGSVIDSLTFQGLCVQHMQSNILGILVLADKLCLQIDLDEYLKYKDRHLEYNTAKVLESIPRLCDIDSSVILILRQNRLKDLQSEKGNIAEFASTVIDTSLSLAKCDWSVACTVKGKYLEEQHKFLSDIYPFITYTLMNKFISSLKDPILPDYSNITDRIASYPQSWRDDNFEEVENISAAGFFYAGYGETGRCFHCGCVLTNIRSQDNPLSKHAARYPSCLYVRHNLTESDIQQAKSDFTGTEEKAKLAEAIRVKYKNIDSRLKTFESYEKTNRKCDIDKMELAEAGFYYVGLENLVQCFNCSVRIYGIPHNQSPWTIHASLSPTCSFVIQERGKGFIRELDTAKEQTLNADYTVITFIRKTCDGTKRREWPKNLFRPW